MRFQTSLILLSLFSAPTYALDECIGSKDSNTVAIYLHGMDTESPSPQELENRKILKKISEILNVGIALPRSTAKCPNKTQLCWGWNFNEAGIIDSALKTSQQTNEKCFPKSKHTGLIGFSNGGFVVNQIVKECRKNDFDWLISIGAGGSWNQTDKKDLSNCGSLTLMAGKKDKSNYESIKELKKWLTEKKANVTIVEYDDGHTIPEKDLQKVLRSVIPK